jgi:hypothetical protein
MKTIGVDLWGDQVRGAGTNNVTCLRPSSQPRLRRSFRELFIGAYASFAERCREVNEPGIALVAVDEISGRSMGIVRLLARVQRHVAAIVGRHDECDLYLNAHQRLALRHLAVVVDPVSDWPAEAEDAWAFLPERVYFDELDRSAQGSVHRVPRVPRPNLPVMSNAITHRSLIISTHGPRDTSDGSLVESGDLAGTLELIGPKNRGTIRIGHDELRDGVLIGRYARCNNAQLADDPSLSRVHALLLQIDDAIVAIDTASLNGTREALQPKARLIQLTGDTELVLGTATRARWHWIS